MKFSGRDLCIMIIFILSLFLLWVCCPRTKVSSKTTAEYKVTNPHQVLWRSGTGLEINVVYVPEGKTLAEHQKDIPPPVVDRLLADHSVFFVEARVAAKTEPALWEIDMYDEARLKDDLGNIYKPTNRKTASQFKRKSLREMFFAFENPIPNNSPIGTIDTVVRGLLVFPKADSRAGNAVLEIPRISNGAPVDFESCSFAFKL